MTEITSLKINDQPFNYYSARYDVKSRESNGAIAQTTYVLISFDTKDNAQAGHYMGFKGHDENEYVPINVNGFDETGYIEFDPNDPVGVIRIRLH